MKAENIEFLEANYHHWFTLKNAFYMKGLNANEREGMQRVMQEEFQPGYSADLWCPSCCADMVRLLYTRYDEYKSANPQQTAIMEQAPLIVKASFPQNIKPVNNEKSNSIKASRKGTRQRKNHGSNSGSTNAGSTEGSQGG